MTAKEMEYEFRLQAMKVDSNATLELSIPAVVRFLNRGILQLCVTRFGSNNNYRATLESIQKRIDEWQKLIVPHFEIAVDSAYTENLQRAIKNVYCFKLPLEDKKPYLFLLRSSYIASKGACKNVIINNTHFVQSDDLNIYFDNPNATPNFEWREINFRLAQDHILAYTDSSFTISKAQIDYLRYPGEMDIEGYKKFDGSASSNIDCELPIFLHPEVVTEAVALFKLSLVDQESSSALAMRQIQE